jgi:CubicO group peptidase (beta-lactamase class C family)
MTKSCIAIWFTVLIFLATAAAAQDANERLDAFVSKSRVDWEVPGLAIAVVKDGQTVFAKGYGVRELGKEDPVDTQTLFQIASTTKAMTAATVGMLVDEGRLTWDDPVVQHLPSFQLHDPYATREMRVRDLLIHRGGLPNTDFLWYPVARPRDDVATLLQHVRPSYSLRSDFVYQNVMYMMAGEVVESVSGKPWGEFIRERLLDPLAMSRTSLGTAEARKRGNAAVDHRRVRSEVRALTQRYEAADEPLAPAGALWSSVDDMTRWIRMVLGEGELDGKRVLSQEMVAEMWRPQTLLPKPPYPTYKLLNPHWSSYGLGWFQFDYQGRAVSFHTGSFEGMAAIVGIIPDEELGVVVLSNLDHAELRHALMLTVFDYYSGQFDGPDWSADLKKLYAELDAEKQQKVAEQTASRTTDTQPTRPLEAYTATYTNRLQGDITITLEGDRLHLAWGNFCHANLEHWHFDTFAFEWPEDDTRVLVSFALDSGGVPHRLSIDGESTWRRIVPGADAANVTTRAAGTRPDPQSGPASPVAGQQPSPPPTVRDRIPPIVPEVIRGVLPRGRNE